MPDNADREDGSPSPLEPFRARLDEMVGQLGALVEHESPSDDLAATRSCARLVAELGAASLGARPELIELGGRTHVRWVGARSRVLLLGHFDTVWPVGSLADHPFRVRDGIATGPGCFDMKAGIVVLMRAVHARHGLAGVTVLLTGDEELGAPTSRPLIEACARAADAVLVLEGSADGGALKIARKGAAFHELRLRGRASHAGLAPERGANATVEAAHQVLAIARLGDPDAGTTVTPTVLRSGTAANTVPASASISVDTRAYTIEEQRRVRAGLAALRPVLAGTELELVDRATHAPLPESASRELFARAGRVAAALGLGELRGARVGGASDGNITAGVGTPTLDGLGAVGGAAHAADEHVVIAALPERAALLAALLDDLLATDTQARRQGLDERDDSGSRVNGP